MLKTADVNTILNYHVTRIFHQQNIRDKNKLDVVGRTLHVGATGETCLEQPFWTIYTSFYFICYKISFSVKLNCQ